MAGGVDIVLGGLGWTLDEILTTTSFESIKWRELVGVGMKSWG